MSWLPSMARATIVGKMSRRVEEPSDLESSSSVTSDDPIAYALLDAQVEWRFWRKIQNDIENITVATLRGIHVAEFVSAATKVLTLPFKQTGETDESANINCHIEDKAKGKRGV